MTLRGNIGSTGLRNRQDAAGAGPDAEAAGDTLGRGGKVGLENDQPLGADAGAAPKSEARFTGFTLLV